MKAVFASLVFTVSGCTLANPAQTQYTVRVIDAETGIPITNATVQTTFLQKRDPWGTGKGKENRVEKSVDENGEAVLTGRTIQKGEGATAFAEDYYSDIESFRFTGKNLALNRWEPWNPTIEVKMRPKKNPVPMVCKSVEWEFKIPKYNTPVGIDLERGDWVQPYGKGLVSDMMIEIIPFDPPEKGSQCRITFPNPQDGIQEHEFEWPSSEFKWPYLAPTNGYMNMLERNYVLNFPKVANAPKHTMKKDVKYIIRTRTQIDDDGKIISACYGFFPREIRFIPKGEFNFTYYFNPVPNERSMEWNGVNLLKKK